jgi:uncharacterized protein YndB with AHSA1/START domain
MSTEPIRRSITVARTPADAFELFTARMSSWWPLETHTRADHDAGEKTEDVIVEPRVGGRVYEVLSSGQEGLWGTVTAWEPPSRVVFDWKPNDEDRPFTEVEVRFSDAGEGRTRVDLEHRRWELLGPELGAEGRADHEPGWAYVFDERFGTAAGAA